MDRVKLQGYLNIAKKAGYVIIGGDKLYNYNKKLYLLIYDKSSAKNTMKIVERIKSRGILTVEFENLQDIINIPNCKLIALKNKKLSEIIYNIIRN